MKQKFLCSLLESIQHLLTRSFWFSFLLFYLSFFWGGGSPTWQCWGRSGAVLEYFLEGPQGMGIGSPHSSLLNALSLSNSPSPGSFTFFYWCVSLGLPNWGSMVGGGHFQCCAAILCQGLNLRDPPKATPWCLGVSGPHPELSWDLLGLG